MYGPTRNQQRHSRTANIKLNMQIKFRCGVYCARRHFLLTRIGPIHWSYTICYDLRCFQSLWNCSSDRHGDLTFVRKDILSEESTFLSLSLSSISCPIPCLFCGAKRLQNTQIETATSFCYHHTCTVTTYVCSLRQGNGHYCSRPLAWERKGKRLTCNKLLTKTTRNYI